jgi:hypothetical protein
VTANGGATPGATGNSGRSSTPRNSNSNSSSSGYSARGGYNPP